MLESTFNSRSRRPLRARRLLAVSAVMGALTLSPAAALAFCIYNEVGVSVHAEVLEGDFDKNISASDDACCHYSNTDCNPGGQPGTMRRAQIQTGTFNCVVAMPAGGYAKIRQESRPFPLPPNYYCVSYDASHHQVDVSNYGVGATARDVHFLVTADPQYENDDYVTKAISDRTLETMLDAVRSDRSVRGLLVAGDLTENTKSNLEFGWYKDAISGMSRFVFDGLGNHDMYRPDFWQAAACQVGDDSCVNPEAIQSDIVNRKRATVLTLHGDPHYSWDWHDVHFVHLNLFPGNEPASTPGYALYNPKDSLAFLITDLALFVGSSGRPVVLVHHYGFDDFSKGLDSHHQVWWTDAQREAYWNAIAPYNVAAIFTGHAHLDADDTNWQIPFVRPGGFTNGPASIPTFVSGGACKGAFVDVRMDQDDIVAVRKDSYGDPASIGRACMNKSAACGRRVASYVGTDNRVRAFGLSLEDGELQVATQNAGGGFSNWQGLGGGLISAPAVGRNADGRLEVFALGTDHALWHIAQTAPNSTTWSGWSSLGGALIGDPVVEKTADGRLHVFVRGIDLSVKHLAQAGPNTGSWSAWTSLGGMLVGDLAVGTNADGRLQVFGRGTDLAIWTIKQSAAYSPVWSGWSSLGGQLISDPAVVARADGLLVVFALGTDRAVWHATQNANGATWSGWTYVGGDVIGRPAVSNAGGNLTVYAVGESRRLQYFTQSSPGGSWQANQQMSGSWISSPTVVPNASGDAHLFALGSDSSVWNRKGAASWTSLSSTTQ